MKISKIISGAQTGADRAGIDAAIALGVPYGGKIPAGRRAEGEPVPEHYTELEVMNERNYLVRTEANVVDSDCTVVFTSGKPRSGSKRTIELAWKHDKPVLHVDVSSRNHTKVANVVIAWLLTLDVELILNVAGSRESSFEEIHSIVYHVMVDVLEYFLFPI